MISSNIINCKRYLLKISLSIFIIVEVVNKFAWRELRGIYGISQCIYSLLHFLWNLLIWINHNNRVAMQPGGPGEPLKVMEFDICPKNQGKVREFQYFIQNSGKVREFEKKIKTGSNFYSDFKTKLPSILSYGHIKWPIFSLFVSICQILVNAICNSNILVFSSNSNLVCVEYLLYFLLKWSGNFILLFE